MSDRDGGHGRPTRVIDCHQHFWHPEPGEYRWLNDAPRVLRRRYAPADLEPLLASGTVDATILIQADPTDRDTDAMLTLAEAIPWVAGVVAWFDPMTASAARLQALARHPMVKGVRPTWPAQGAADWFSHRAARDALARLSDAEMCLDVLTSFRDADAVRCLAGTFPRMPMVLNHAFAPPDETEFRRWRDAIRLVAQAPNTFCKISGMQRLLHPKRASHLELLTDELFRWFGSERLLWGSDWPVLLHGTDYPTWLAKAKALVTGRTDQDGAMAVMGGNAATLYRLAPGLGGPAKHVNDLGT